MNRSGNTTIPSWGLVLLAFAALWLVPTQSNAATSSYPSGDASSFATTNGGWTASAEYAGLCVQGLTCPTMTGTYEGTGGVGGSADGFIRANSSSTTLLALLSTSKLIWTSPSFTYNGAGGQNPDQVGFSVEANSELANLLNLGVTATVTAKVVATSGGAEVTVIDNVSPGIDSGWKTLSGTLGSNALAVGQNYRIRLELSVGGLAAILPSGSVGFDNVILTASKQDGGGGGGGNGGGGNGGGGAGTVIPPPKNIPAGQAYYYKGKLFIRVRCTKRFRPRCNVRGVVLTKKRRGKAMSRAVRTRVRTGTYRRVTLTVKPRFRKRMQKLSKVRHKTIVVRLKINSKRGKKKATVFHRLRVIQRRK